MRTLYPSKLNILSRYLPVSLILALSLSATAQTFVGDVTISTQDDLDAFAPAGGGTYDAVTGNFIIRPIGDPNTNQILTDFSNVVNLVTIDGEFRIDNYETEQTVGNPLAEFTSLDSLGLLRIFDNTTFNSGITTLSNSTLRVVGGLFEVGNNDRLAGSLSFTALTTVGGSFIVRNHLRLRSIRPTNLITIGGNFRIIDNDVLASLDNFQNVANFSGGFFVQDNAQLGNIDGFANISNVRFTIPALVITNNPGLETLGGTPGPNVIKLNVTDSIIITGNSILREISTEVNAGVEDGDEELSTIRVIGNNLLQSVARILDRDYIVTIGTLEIVNNPVLTAITSQPTTLTNTLIIANNDQLTTAGGNFQTTTALSGDLIISDNDNLGTFIRLGGTDGGEDGLTTVAGNVFINDNPQLTNLEGLRRLVSAASLTLDSLGRITTLDALRSLTTLADSFLITNNTRLSDCCEPFCEVTVNGGQMDGFNEFVTITGNTGQCADKQTAVNACADEPGKGCLAAAPVEWLAFTGSLGASSIDLEFSTATESDNDYFQIERSVAGGAFEAIGQVDGAGDSQAALYYSFSDYDYSSGLNYYRIRQVDFDGTEAFSDVIVVDAGGSKLALTMFPNPANGSDVTLQLGRDWNADKVTAQIYSVSGQFVREVRATGNSRLFLPTADLQAGMYAIRVSDGSRTVTTRLTVR